MGRQIEPKMRVYAEVVETLRRMEIDDRCVFPLEQTASVQSYVSRLRRKGLDYMTKSKEEGLFVIRIK